MLLIYRDEKLWEEMSAQQRVAAYQEAVDFTEGLRKSGVYQGGAPLEHVSTATTVRMKQGKPVMTDGPFAETKEALGGYSIVEAKDLVHATELSKGCPILEVGDIKTDTAPRARHATADNFLPEGTTLDEYEQSIIKEALHRANGNKSQAARMLGLTRNALRYRLSQMGIES